MAWCVLRWVLLLGAIAAYSPQAAYNSYVSTDQMYQIAMTHSLLQGQGLTVSAASTARNDLSQIQRGSMVLWPPGFSILMALLLPVAQSISQATAIINVLSVVLFFCGWFVSLEVSGPALNSETKTAIWLYWIFAKSPLGAFAWSDSLALAALSLNAAACLVAVRYPRLTIWAGLAAGLFMGLAVGVRYAYWPLFAVAPLGLIFYAFRFDRRLFKTAIANTLMAGVLLGAVVLYNRQAADSFTFIDRSYRPFEYGWYWGQLHSAIPFPVYALGINSYKQMFNILQRLSDSVWQLSLWGVSLIWLVSFLVHCFHTLVGQYAQVRQDKTRQPGQFLVVYLLLTFGLTYAMLIYMSVHFIEPEPNLTYITLERYYLPLYPIVIVSGMLFVSHVFSNFSLKPHRLLLMILGSIVAIILLGSFVQGLRVTSVARRLINYAPTSDEFQLGSEVAGIIGAIERVQRDNPGKPVIYTTALSGVEITKANAAMAGAALLSRSSINDIKLSTTKPVSLVIGIPHADFSDASEIAALAQLCKLHTCAKLIDSYRVDLYFMAVSPTEDSGPVQDF